MGISSVLHVVTEDIKHADHLAENKYTMAVGFQPNKKLVQQYKFAAVHDDAFEGLVFVVGILLCALEEEWMIGSFFQLHSYVEETDVAVSIGTFHESGKILDSC